MPHTQPDQIWTVSAINQATRELLQASFGAIWIEAEISNLARPASGHLYFSLKDANAQLRAAFFRQRQRGAAADLNNGDQVLVRGRLSLYEPRGDYQLIVEHVEAAGEGALRREFERLKRLLAAEGLFATSRKRRLPTMPSRIGVITSPSGAAVRDVIKVLRRRMPSIPVTVFGASVQGRDAPSTLNKALQLAVKRDDCDILLVVRGGGSLEDLAAFNDELLARAMAESPIPIVTGVGHETDVTIADFIADVRAPTPSAAAELASPDRHDWLRTVALRQSQLVRSITNVTTRQAQRLDRTARRLHRQNPKRRLSEQHRLVRHLASRLRRAVGDALNERTLRLSHQRTRLWVQTPARRLQRDRVALRQLRDRLIRAETHHRDQASQKLARLARTLQAVSPLATLGRGYAVLRDDTGRAITDAADARAGQRVRVTLRDGEIGATVDAVTVDEDAATPQT